MPDQPAGEVLRASSLFGALDDASLAALLQAGRRRTVQRGGFLFFEGDDSTSLVVLVAGRLKLVVTSPGGEQLLLGTLEPPAVLGEIGVIDGGPRSATAEVLEDATVLMFPAAEIWRLLRADFVFVEAMLTHLTRRTRTLTKTTADLVFLDLPGRLARLLAETTAGDAAGGLRGLSQAELGQRVGASRQSVNAALQMFARRRWVELSRQQVSVLDAEALERFAVER
ncbi:MAG: Crp/Fnr family transcriptional regulator [Actinomycetota bacterium]|nr:Crp/Fnr family transcriptional regulator [Actinomycetota bacterium]